MVTTLDGAPPTVPMSGYTLVDSTDVDVARAAVGEAFCDHRLTPLGHADPAHIRFNGVRFDALGLFYLDYGTPVQIDPVGIDDFYLIQVPLSGTAVIGSAGTDLISTPQLASVLQPGMPGVSMRWEGDNRQMLVRIERTAVEAHLRKKLGRVPRDPVRFDVAMRTESGSIRSWMTMVDLLLGQAESGTPHGAIAVEEIQQLIIGQLILSQPNNYVAELVHGQPAVVPRVIRRAAEIIEAHAGETLVVEDIAEAVGIGVRALQDGFRRHYDTTPIAFLRDTRLAGIRTELLDSDAAAVTVTEIASRWGFLHHGRFSVLYRQRYGESPSATLRR